jgi:dTDP-4-dehydrorhamnose reductase
MRRLLVTGASGLLGRHVAAQALTAGWEVIGTYRTSPLPLPVAWQHLDITNRAAVEQMIEEAQPTAIVHTAYIQHGPAMWATTAEGAAAVAVAARRVGARLVHLSSDVIFDGTASPYDEHARPSPIMPYGAAKAAAETAVSAVAADAAIVRTSLIISREPPDQHTRLALDVAAGRRPERLFTDEFRCPVAVEDLAAAVLELAEAPYQGIINVAGAEALNRHALGVAVALVYGIDPATVPSATLAASGLRRPADLRLDISRARALLTTRLRGIRDYLGVAPWRRCQ